jgi:Mn2+/Fe2+ NRAMP family transporter
MKNKITQTEAEMLELAETKGPLGKAAIYTKLSGPGWLQGAITLGGGSLAGALYLGVIAGFSLMWLQPLAMVCGIIMLAAIAYVTLTTKERPFGLINRNLSPALGWAWLIATVMANIVWCMPQYNLARAALQQNLIPSIGSSTTSTAIICVIILITAFSINVLYESESGKGVKIFDRIIKTLVALIVLSFFAVIGTLTFSGTLDWGAILKGFIPAPSLLFAPSADFKDLIAASSNPEWWTTKIVSDQRDIIITAFGTAVGINMTWLLPYSLLKKKWGKRERGLAIFDLSLGLFIPFFLATSCVVIAAASQFHASTTDVFDEKGGPIPQFIGDYNKNLAGLLEKTPIAGAIREDKSIDYSLLPEADRQLAGMLLKRDNFQLATTLEPLAGPTVSQKIFGFGVLGMAISTIIILMLMNGLAFQELFGKPGNKAVHLFGCSVSGIAGAIGPFIWTGGAAAALAVPTSVIGGSLIPIAYFTFFLMMNSKKILGDAKPTGGRAVLWNALMIFATSIATFGSVWTLSGKGLPGTIGIIILAALAIVGTIGFFRKAKSPA